MAREFCSSVILKHNITQIRLTQKVQTAAGLKKHELAEIRQIDSLPGSWYANLFTVERRNALVFMNEQTLFSFLLVGVKKPQFANLAGLFASGLKQTLQNEGFSDTEIKHMFAGLTPVEFTATNSRRALGNLNDLIHCYKSSIVYRGGLQHCDLDEIIRGLNQMPQRNLDWKTSGESLQQLLEVK